MCGDAFLTGAPFPIHCVRIVHKRAEYVPSARDQHSLDLAVVVAFHHPIALMLR